MKTESYRVNRFLLMAGCTLALGGVRVAAAAPGPKVTICHFPPGNPANVQVITVGAPAVPAHIANHNDVVCSAGDSDCCFGGSHPSVCTNFATDVNNCGACGNGCSTGASCTGGSCVAPTPTDTPAPTETPTDTPTPQETPTNTPFSCIGVACPECQICDPTAGGCVEAPPNSPCGTCGAGTCQPHCGSPACTLTCINANAGTGIACASDADCSTPAGTVCVSSACDPHSGSCVTAPPSGTCFAPCP